MIFIGLLKWVLRGPTGNQERTATGPWSNPGMPWYVQITWERHRRSGISLSESIECTAREQGLSSETLAQLRECFSPDRASS